MNNEIHETLKKLQKGQEELQKGQEELKTLVKNVKKEPKGLIEIQQRLVHERLAVPVPEPPVEYVGASGPTVRALSSHDEIKGTLVQIGKLQGYLAESEYSFDIGKLDVVWRRVLNSVPTYVFEIQVGGDVYHALSKLKHAFDLWNSHIFIVASENERNKVDNLLSGTFHEIGPRIKFIELEQVEELYRRKKAYLDFEKELGI